MARVTIIIPTHNRAEFLRSAITSVLNQTFQDFEIIVVDDASKDHTFEVVRGFSDRRIKYLYHKTNKGGSAARNTGIINSKAEYSAFLDDDDEWLPVKLQRQVDLLQQSPPEVGAVYTGYIVVDRSSGRVLGERIPSSRGNLANGLLGSNPIGGASTMLVRRKCFERVGPFDETLPSFQDYDMWIRIAREFLIDYIKEPLFKYYMHENKIWTNPDGLLRGMEIMLKKYGDSRIVRKNFAYHYLSLGVHYCQGGNAKSGRKAFVKALRLYPYEMRNYFNLCLSMLGPRNFRRAKESKEKFLALLR